MHLKLSRKVSNTVREKQRITYSRTHGIMEKTELYLQKIDGGSQGLGVRAGVTAKENLTALARWDFSGS